MLKQHIYQDVSLTLIEKKLDEIYMVFRYGQKMKQHLSVWENLRYRKLFLQSHQWTLIKRRHFMIITKMPDINWKYMIIRLCMLQEGKDILENLILKNFYSENRWWFLMKEQMHITRIKLCWLLAEAVRLVLNCADSWQKCSRRKSLSWIFMRMELMTFSRNWK